MALPPHHLLHDEPVSRTHQYRKVMKPLLERKRRARINRCLDELKELMVTALATDGDNVSKLEKADILELTVRHLHGLRGQQGRPDRFVAGFAQCAREVTLFVGEPAGRGLLQHLGACARRLDDVAAAAPTPVWRPW